MQGQLGEEHGEEHLGQGFRPLVQPETPLMADLDPVVQKADEAEEDHRHDRQVPRPREPDLGAEVADDIADDDAADDGDSSHGRRSGLDAVTGRTVLADGLPDALRAQPPQEDRRDQNAHPQRDAAAVAQTEHGLIAFGLRGGRAEQPSVAGSVGKRTDSARRASTTSSKGSLRPAISW